MTRSLLLWLRILCPLNFRICNTNCSLKVRIYLEGKFFEIKAENVDIALVTARLSNEDIGKFFSKITLIIDYNLYNLKFTEITNQIRLINPNK